MGHVAAVVGAEHGSLLTGSLPSAGAAVEAIEQLGGTVLAMASDPSGMLLVNRAQIPGQDSLALSELAREHNLKIEAVAALTLVGAGLLAVVPGILQTLADSKTSFRLISASDALVVLAMEPAVLKASLETLHTKFCGKD